MKILVSLFLLALVAQSYADLPVHCLKHHIVGNWHFEVTKLSQLDDPYENACGHKHPDDASISYLAMHKQFKAHEKFSVDLRHDYFASGDSLGTGQWTMIYDEGMDVELGDHQFTAFFSYFPDESGKVMSYCGKTVVGWYVQKRTGEKACFRATKSVTGDDTDLYVAPLSQMYVVEPDEYQSLLQKKDNYKFLQTKSKTLNLHKESTNHDEIVKHLNDKVEKSWTAKAHSSFHGKNLAQLNRMAGKSKRNHGWEGYERKSLKKEFVQRVDVSDLPKNFDWSSALQPPREQLDCGSCYVFATIQMIEARLKIKTGTHVRLSPQHVIDCSYHNQGCEGGYPFLVERFATEFELVPESCSPYKGIDGKCGTCKTESLNEVYKVRDYKFVGGSYGLSDERNMMLEIKENGPIVASFEPTYDFMYYEGGIYHSVDAHWMTAGMSKPEWERVDHSVLLYGWGETDQGEKYWKLLNSWGNGWGENGHFRMKRGVDESAIESLAEAATPYVVRQ